MFTNERKSKENINLIQEVSEVNLLNCCATFACRISMQKKCLQSTLI